MNKAESLMANYPELKYKFESLMPKKLKGFIKDSIVYLNPRQSTEELASTVAEEIAHHLTSVGDIIELDTNEKRKQEQKARDVGATMVVTPQDIIDCYHERFDTVWQCADFLGITNEAFEQATKVYSKLYESGLEYKNYKIYFRPNGTIGVYEWFE